MRQWRLSPGVAVALIGVLWAGCRHTAVAPVGEGVSSYKFVERTPPPARNAGTARAAVFPTEQLINAQPIPPLAAAVYPKAALAAHAGSVTVGVLIMVGTDGCVADMGASFATLSTPTPWAAEFRAAVEDAVKQWRFRPAEIRQLELVKADDGDYQRVARREKAEWTFDVEFTFSATGEVVSGLAR